MKHDERAGQTQSLVGCLCEFFAPLACAWPLTNGSNWPQTHRHRHTHTVSSGRETFSSGQDKCAPLIKWTDASSSLAVGPQTLSGRFWPLLAALGVSAGRPLELRAKWEVQPRGLGAGVCPDHKGNQFISSQRGPSPACPTSSRNKRPTSGLWSSGAQSSTKFINIHASWPVGAPLRLFVSVREAKLELERGNRVSARGRQT